MPIDPAAILDIHRTLCHTKEQVTRIGRVFNTSDEEPLVVYFFGPEDCPKTSLIHALADLAPQKISTQLGAILHHTHTRVDYGYGETHELYFSESNSHDQGGEWHALHSAIDANVEGGTIRVRAPSDNLRDWAVELVDCPVDLQISILDQLTQQRVSIGTFACIYVLPARALSPSEQLFVQQLRGHSSAMVDVLYERYPGDIRQRLSTSEIDLPSCPMKIPLLCSVAATGGITLKEEAKERFRQTLALLKTVCYPPERLSNVLHTAGLVLTDIQTEVNQSLNVTLSSPSQDLFSQLNILNELLKLEESANRLAPVESALLNLMNVAECSVENRPHDLRAILQQNVNHARQTYRATSVGAGQTRFDQENKHFTQSLYRRQADWYDELKSIIKAIIAEASTVELSSVEQELLTKLNHLLNQHKDIVTVVGVPHCGKSTLIANLFGLNPKDISEPTAQGIVSPFATATTIARIEPQNAASRKELVRIVLLTENTSTQGWHIQTSAVQLVQRWLQSGKLNTTVCYFEYLAPVTPEQKNRVRVERDTESLISLIKWVEQYPTRTLIDSDDLLNVFGSPLILRAIVVFAPEKNVSPNNRNVGLQISRNQSEYWFLHDDQFRQTSGGLVEHLELIELTMDGHFRAQTNKVANACMYDHQGPIVYCITGVLPDEMQQYQRCREELEQYNLIQRLWTVVSQSDIRFLEGGRARSLGVFQKVANESIDVSVRSSDDLEQIEARTNAKEPFDNFTRAKVYLTDNSPHDEAIKQLRNTLGRALLVARTDIFSSVLQHVMQIVWVGQNRIEEKLHYGQVPQRTRVEKSKIRLNAQNQLQQLYNQLEQSKEWGIVWAEQQVDQLVRTATQEINQYFSELCVESLFRRDELLIDCLTRLASTETVILSELKKITARITNQVRITMQLLPNDLHPVLHKPKASRLFYRAKLISTIKLALAVTEQPKQPGFRVYANATPNHMVTAIKDSWQQCRNEAVEAINRIMENFIDLLSLEIRRIDEHNAQTLENASKDAITEKTTVLKIKTEKFNHWQKRLQLLQIKWGEGYETDL